MTMGGIDLSALGMVVAVATGLGSYFLGRHWRKGRVAKKQARERAALEATQSRQVRRARERSQRR